MLNELQELQKRLQTYRKDLYNFYSRLDPAKNAKSREEILAAQLKVMEAIGRLDKILKQATKKEDGGAEK
jgi:hypothetical protein